MYMRIYRYMSPQCGEELQRLLRVFSKLGVQIVEGKLMGSTVSLTFLYVNNGQTVTSRETNQVATTSGRLAT